MFSKSLKRSLCLLSFLIPLGNATIRVDVGDRSREEVVQKSYRLAAQNNFSQVTGAIWFNDGDMATGIALDPHTVLTAAHGNLKDAADIRFKLGANAADRLKTPPHVNQIIIRKPIIHPSYVEVTPQPVTETENIALERLVSFTIDDFLEPKDSGMPKFFHGTDLAILKLDRPLPSTLKYPEILGNDVPIVDTYGETLGFGCMLYNDQVNGPIQISEEFDKIFIQHLLSTKVSSHRQLDQQLFYGKYRGLLIHGNESFIPDATMKKTEGLPVQGDSGGPLFINGCLAGICAATLSINQSQLGEEANHWKNLIQPVLPIWTDVRAHKNWIQQHMGKIG